MRSLLARQAGVVARFQLLELGLSSNDVARLVRRRDLSPLHAGVYVDHTGPPSSEQRAWGAVLSVWPAGLSGATALLAHEGWAGPPPRAVEVVVARDRKVVRRPGTAVRRHDGLLARVRWDLGPPRLRYDDAVVDVAARAPDRLAAVARLTQAVQARRTTPTRLLTALEQRERLPHRRFLVAVLHDVASGVSSVLEHGYVHRVERPHGIRPACRQVRDRQGEGVVYRDFDYGPVIVEADGRLHHEGAAERDRDMDRDLAAAGTGRVTLRVSWGQVYDRPCRTAARVATALAAHGVRSGAVPCSPSCPV